MTLRALVLTAGFLVFTVLLGWWTVPVLGFVWGIIARKRARASLTAGMSAVVAWGTLLVWSAVTGPVSTLATQLGAIANVPGGVFVALTLLLPFLLAVVAAAVPLSLRGTRRE